MMQNVLDLAQDRNHKKWSAEDTNILLSMQSKGYSFGRIAKELGRSEKAVEMKLSKLRSSLGRSSTRKKYTRSGKYKKKKVDKPVAPPVVNQPQQVSTVLQKRVLPQQKEPSFWQRVFGRSDEVDIGMVLQEVKEVRSKLRILEASHLKLLRDLGVEEG